MSKRKRCTDPRGIGCKRPQEIKRTKTCLLCYKWLRYHGKITVRKYFRRGEV